MLSIEDSWLAKHAAERWLQQLPAQGLSSLCITKLLECHTKAKTIAMGCVGIRVHFQKAYLRSSHFHYAAQCFLESTDEQHKSIVSFCVLYQWHHTSNRLFLFITGSSSSLPAVHADDVGLGEDVVGAGEGGVDGGGHRVLALTHPLTPTHHHPFLHFRQVVIIVTPPVVLT